MNRLGVSPGNKEIGDKGTNCRCFSTNAFRCLPAARTTRAHSGTRGALKRSSVRLSFVLSLVPLNQYSDDLVPCISRLDVLPLEVVDRIIELGASPLADLRLFFHLSPIFHRRAQRYLDGCVDLYSTSEAQEWLVGRESGEKIIIRELDLDLDSAALSKEVVRSCTTALRSLTLRDCQNDDSSILEESNLKSSLFCS